MLPDLQRLPSAPQPLPRSLGVPAVLFLTLSATTPASSLFVIVPGMLAVAGSGALWAMLLASLVGVATAFVYAELSSAWPVAGGEYVMVARTLGPLPGFVVLGVNVFNNLIFVPTVALGVAEMLGRVAPGLPPVPVAIATTLLATAFGLANIRVNALVTGLFLLVEVAAIGVVAATAFAAPARPFAALLASPVTLSGVDLVPAGAGAIGLATTIGIFALNGYGMAVYFGEEMREAPQRIARVVLLALVATLVLEVVPLAVALMGAADLAGFFSAADPFGGLVAAQAGRGWAAAVSLGVVAAIVNAAIVSVLAFARFFYATGRDGVWGGRVGQRLTLLHPRAASPWIATLLVGGVGVACCFLPLTFLLVLSGAGLVVTYAALALAALAGRRRGTTDHAPYRMPGYPLAPLFTLVALAYVIYTSWLDVAEGRPGLMATAAQMLLAAVYYVLVLRRRGLWVTRDPAP